MPHIHTNKGEVDHTASAYVLRTDHEDGEARIMLHRHKKLGVYMQFGGHIELTENAWQAITHELVEESGYELSQLKIMQPALAIRKLADVESHPMPVSHNTHPFDDQATHFHSDIGYLFVTDQEPNQPLAEGESEEIKLFSREELLKLPESEIFVNVREIGQFCLDLYANDRSGWVSLDAESFS